MLPIKARSLYIKAEAAEDPRSMARVERMLPHIEAPGPMRVLDDDAWYDLVTGELAEMPRHGREADAVEPIVIFNQFLYHHGAAERRRRRERYPKLFEGNIQHYSGYSGFDWRPSGDAEYRRTTGLVCQPAYALHSFWGCHYRCNYCNLGRVANVNVNLEDWVEHIRRGLSDLRRSPRQKLFQWDNGTDIPCWEPEYGGTELLVHLFAEQPDKYLELYVGKSDDVDYLLDFDHRGHTTCCWSISGETQARTMEKRSAGLDGRLDAARKCRSAGYPVRIRYSPVVPVVGWEEEVRDMVRRTFDAVSPEVLTVEPLRFHDHADLLALYEPGSLDPVFVEAMRGVDDGGETRRKQFPEELRARMYRVIFDAVAEVSPRTPVAFCREARSTWDLFRDEFGRLGQHPDRYVCNCGPFSDCANPALAGVGAGPA